MICHHSDDCCLKKELFWHGCYVAIIVAIITEKTSFFYKIESCNTFIINNSAVNKPASGVEGRGFESRRVYHLIKNPCKKTKNQSLQTGLQTVFLFYPFRLLRTRGITPLVAVTSLRLPVLRRVAFAAKRQQAHFASLVSNPAGCTMLDTYPQEFTTFADFLLYVVKCCKNMLIAVEITAFLRHDYGRTQMLYKL